MKLSTGSGGKPQSVEEGIGGRSFRLAPDPFLGPCQSYRGLMDVVAVDIGEGLEQLLDAFIASAKRMRCRRGGAASWRPDCGPHSADVSHPAAFPRDIPAQIAGTDQTFIQSHGAAG